LIKVNKPALVRWLNPKDAAGCLEAWAECAAIAEFDGGLSGHDAEELAWREHAATWDTRATITPGTPPEVLERFRAASLAMDRRIHDSQ
jgi:hypothetical protein